MNSASIPEDRPLTIQEQTLVRWILEQGGAAAARYLPQLHHARVISRCPCGCASIDFAIEGVVPPFGQAMGVLAEFEYRTLAGGCCGVFVFACGGLLAGLEVWSIDGQTIPAELPQVTQLKPLGSD